MDFECLEGKMLQKVNVTKTRVSFYEYCNDTEYALYHPGDCCEKVMVAKVVGELEHLIKSRILVAKKIAYYPNEAPVGFRAPICLDPIPDEENFCYSNPKKENFIWTLYFIATQQGCVFIWWYGVSREHGGQLQHSKRIEFGKTCWKCNNLVI